MFTLLVFVHLLYVYYVFTNVVVFEVSAANDIFSPFSVHVYFNMFFIVSSMIIFMIDSAILFSYRTLD